MSSINRQKTSFSSDSQNRDAVSERICDDLSEEVFQYLSLEDKLKLEFVSKQFQRTIFRRQYELTVRMENSSQRKVMDRLLFKYESFDLKSLEALLKKSPNITSIQLNDFYSCDNYNEFIALITKFCNNLVEFRAPLNPISETAFNEFHQKFGSKIKRFQNSMFSSLKRKVVFRNIEELVFESYFTHKTQLEEICLLELDNLKTLRASINLELSHSTKKLIDNFTSVWYLHLNLNSEYDRSEMNLILMKISNLKNLIVLKFSPKYGLNESFFSDSLEQMANNCQKLKSFEYYLTISPENLKNILNPFRRFKQLKRLKIQINFIGKFDKIISFDIFEGFANITHLSLNLNGIRFDKNSLTNIDTYLPKLQSLICGGLFDGTPEMAPQMADILSRLSNFEVIKIKSFNQLFCLRFKEEIIKKCRKIRRIDIKYSNVQNKVLLQNICTC